MSHKHRRERHQSHHSSRSSQRRPRPDPPPDIRHTPTDRSRRSQPQHDRYRRDYTDPHYQRHSRPDPPYYQQERRHHPPNYSQSARAYIPRDRGRDRGGFRGGYRGGSRGGSRGTRGFRGGDRSSPNKERITNCVSQALVNETLLLYNKHSNIKQSNPTHTKEEHKSESQTINLRKIKVITNQQTVQDASFTTTQYSYDVYQCSEQKENTNNDTSDTSLLTAVTDANEKRIIYKKSLRQLRALSPHVFDGNHLFSFTHKDVEKTIQFKTQNGYKIILNQVNSTRNNKTRNNEFLSNVPIEFIEQGLNIMNRSRYRSADYVQVDSRERAYYSLNTGIRNMPQQNTLQYPDLKALSGFMSSVHVVNGQFVVKTKPKTKLVTKYSINDMIKHYGLRKTKQFIQNKRAITTYDKQIIKISDIRQDMNLESTFMLTQTQKEISYYDYYTKIKGIKLLEDHEDGMIECMRYYQGKEKTNHYPPQLLHVIVPVEYHTDNTKKELRKAAHCAVEKVINEAIAINKRLNATKRTLSFKTNNEPVTVDGYILNDPLICFKGRDGVRCVPAQPVHTGQNSFGGKEWKNVRGFCSIHEINNGNKGYKRRSGSTAANWVIYYDGNDNRAARKLYDQFGLFLRDRQFRPEDIPLNRPKLVGVNYMDLNGIRNIVRRDAAIACSVFVISDGMNGSKQKRDISRSVLFKKGNSCNYNIDLQFIMRSTCFSKTKCYSLIENVLLKNGINMYWIDPRLPSNKLNVRNLWTMGIRILRKKDGINVCIASLNRAPLVGSLKYLTNHCTLIPSNIDVIPQTLCNELMDDVLSKAIKYMKHNKELVPLNIIVYRQSGGDSILGEIMENEYNAIKQILNKYDATRHIGLIFTVVQENYMDAIAVFNNNNNKYNQQMFTPNYPIAITEGIGDFLLSYPVRQDGSVYSRITRVIVMNKSKTYKMDDLIQLTYSLHWAYSLNIPFPKTPNFVAPLKYAQHYGEWLYENITSSDVNACSLMIDVNGPKPHLLSVKGIDVVMIE